MNATLGHRIHFSSCSFIIETHVLKKLVRHVEWRHWPLAAPHMYPIIFTSSFRWHNTEAVYQEWKGEKGGGWGGGGNKGENHFLVLFLVYEFACTSEDLDIQWYLLCLLGVCWHCIAQLIFIRIHFWFFFAACTLVNITGLLTSCELACCQDNLCDPFNPASSTASVPASAGPASVTASAPAPSPSSTPTSASVALVANVCAILLANVLIIFAQFH